MNRCIRTVITVCWFLGPLSLTFTFAQLAVLAADPSEAYGLEVVAGDAEIIDLLAGKSALVFFNPAGCSACDEFTAFDGFVVSQPVPVIMVTNASRREARDWANSHPGWNTWLDPQDELAMLLGVKEVPSLYLVEDGAVVNADYWPFHAGLNGVLADLEYFAKTSTGPKLQEIVDSLRGINLTGVALVHSDGSETTLGSGGLPSLVIVCWPGCSVCQESAGYFRHLYDDYPGLPKLVLVSIVDDAGLGTTASAFEPWRKAGFAVTELPRNAASVLDLQVSPVMLLVEADGTVSWASAGFSATTGDLVVRQWEER